jgi:transposase
VSPKRHCIGLYFTLLPDNENVNAEDVVRFLRHLKRHIPGPLTIVWDRSNTHDRAALVRRYLARHPEIVTEKFPGYAPELNPEEQVWTYTKYARLPNFAPRHTSDLRIRLTYELKRLRKRPDLLLSFIRHSDLPLGL